MSDDMAHYAIDVGSVPKRYTSGTGTPAGSQPSAASARTTAPARGGCPACTSGIQFAEAWKRRKTVTYEGQEFYILSKEDLIASKRAAGRAVDLEDVRLLEMPESENEAGEMGGCP